MAIHHWAEPVVHRDPAHAVLPGNGATRQPVTAQPQMQPVVPAPQTSGMQALAALVGRLLLAQIFLMAGSAKILDWTNSLGHATGGFQRFADVYGIGAADFLAWASAPLLIAAIVFEIGGAVSLVLGWCARFGAFALFFFLVPATLVFHGFWTFPEAEQQMQMINFMKNLAIMGGLWMVMAFGPGRFSVDRA